MQFAPGDFFRDELRRTDVIAMGHILHDWDMPTKRMLIEKAHGALSPGDSENLASGLNHEVDFVAALLVPAGKLRIRPVGF